VTLVEVSTLMYRALVNAQCGCCRKWDKESKTEDGYTVTYLCQKHRAMRAYEDHVRTLIEEALTGQEVHQ
jgi:hypothetical protein